MARYKIEVYVPRGHDQGERIRFLEQYVSRLSQELEYVLGHLDKDNFTPEERERIQNELIQRCIEKEEE